MSTENGQKSGRQPTRLQSWLDTNGFTSAQLERKVPMSRQSMTKVRAGRDVRRKTMIRILRAARDLKNDPMVKMDDLFDLDPDSPLNRE